MIDSQRRCAVRLSAFATKRELWKLDSIARIQGLTISELIRQTLEEHYGVQFDGQTPLKGRGNEPITFSVEVTNG